MDITIYDDILEGLKAYNEKIGKPYGNSVASMQTTDTRYPLTVLSEINNTADRIFNTCRERLSTLGYRLTVYAKDSRKAENKADKRTVARQIAQKMNEFLTDYVGLHQIGFSERPLLNDNSIFQVDLTYAADFHENRRTIY
jgi:hypothetical protein